MKTRRYLLVATATALAATAWAQENRPFSPPPAAGGSPPPQQPASPPKPPGEPPTPETRAAGPAESQPSQPPPADAGEQKPHGERHGRPEAEVRKQPFLGVVTSEAPDSMRNQLNLPEGFGLVVEDVLPGSPAENAGLKKYDILKLLNDQQLTNPDQLATLVRAAGSGSQISLTVIRQGQEQKLWVKVGEHPMRQHRPRGEEGEMRGMPPFPHEGRFGGREDRWRERSEQWGKDAQAEIDRMHRQAERQFRDRRGESDASASNGGESSAGAAEQTRSRLVVRDAEGEVAVTNDNGNKTLTAKTPDGKVVFNGPVNTDEERKAVPDAFKKKLDVLQNVQVRGLSGAGEASTQPEDSQ